MRSNERMAADLSKLEALEKQSLASLKTQAGSAKKSADDQKSRDFWFKVGLGIVVGGLVVYFLSEMYITKHKFPRLVKWYDENVGGTSVKPAKDTPAYSLTQVTVCSENSLFQKFMNLLLLWPNLNQEGATFLMHSIWEFTSNKETDLKAEHWWGGWESYGSGVTEEKLTGTGGVFCSHNSDGSKAAGAEEAKKNLWKNWTESKEWNIWVPFLPQDVGSWSNVPCIRQLWDPSAPEALEGCSSIQATDSMMWLLFNGGLCRIAFEATLPDRSSSSVFRNYFVGDPNPTAMCGIQAAQGAMKGASGGAMAGIGMMGTPAMANPYGALAVGGLTLISSAVGGFLGGDASNTKCEEKMDDDDEG